MITKEIRDKVTDYLKWETMNIYTNMALSEHLERKGLKNSARYIKAINQSRLFIISKLLRNLEMPEDDIGTLIKLREELKNEKAKYFNEIEALAEKSNLPGCKQTIYFSKNVLEKENEQLEEIIRNAKLNQDSSFENIYVCPLCGLVILENLERCPLCGANKAIFREF